MYVEKSAASNTPGMTPAMKSSAMDTLALTP
jgi:hypothetical protein